MTRAMPPTDARRRPGWGLRLRLALAVAARTTGGRLALLGAMVVAVWLGTAAVAAATDAQSSYGMALWSGLRHLFDPGSLGDDETTAQRIVGVAQVFTGLIFLAGVAFTVLSDGVERGLRRLSESEPPVTTTGHLLLIGSGPVRDAVLDRLDLDPPPALQTVVALAPSAGDAPDRAKRPYRLVARTGDPKDPVVLATAGAAAASGIVYAGGASADAAVADLEALQVAATLAEHLDGGGPPPHVAVHVDRAANVTPVWSMLPASFDAVPGDRNVGAILALGVALPAYPSILDSPAGADDGGPYVVAPGALTGARFGDAVDHFPDALPIGLLRAGRAEYAPAPDTPIESSDGIVVVAADRAAAGARGRPSHPGSGAPATLALEPDTPEPRRVLVLGWSAAGADLVRERNGPDALTVLALLDDPPAGVAAGGLRRGDPADAGAIAAAVADVDPAIVVLLAGANGGTDPRSCHARSALAALTVSGLVERPALAIVVEQRSSAQARRLRAADPRIRVISRAELSGHALVLSSTDRPRLLAQEGLALDARLTLEAVRHAGDDPVPMRDAYRALLAQHAVPLSATRAGEEIGLFDPAAATIRRGDGLLLLRRLP